MEKSCSKRKIAVVGGDARMFYAAEELCSTYEVALYGYSAERLPPIAPERNVTRAYDLSGTLRGASAVLLPLPYSDAGENYIRTPLLEIGKISVCSFFSAVERGAIIFGGRFGARERELADVRGAALFDYEADPVVTLTGAVATAEGAIAVAMEQTKITLFGSNCLIFGYGRCARSLSRRMLALGARVTAAARSEQNLAEAACDGNSVVSLADENGLRESLRAADIIFNTVPALVLNGERLARVRADAVIIDIATSPGGCDFEAAAARGVFATLLPGLPGIVAPKSSGVTLAKRAREIIEKHTRG